MIKKLFVGSNNQNKINEIKEIFKLNSFDIEIICPKNFNDNNEPIEDGLSFKENSYIKAKHYYDLYRMPCIGEDSGITIDYFNGFPGIHSKRFLGTLSDYEKNEYILKLMKDVKTRKASFHTCICYIDNDGNDYYFEGINNGEISLKQSGDEGFGYDPIFLIPEYNKTEAELGLAYKNKNSHRSKALNKFIQFLNENEKE